MKNKTIVISISIIIIILIIWAILPNKNTGKISDIKNEETKTVSKTKNKLCDWIDKSDIIIKLNLPEKYGYYKDDKKSPSYETGLMFKSSYGDIASSRRLARKACDYRVGFSKKDFKNINYNPNYPFVIISHRDSSTDFTYDKEPIKLTLNKDNLPNEGKEFILNVNGETSSFKHYQKIFK